MRTIVAVFAKHGFRNVAEKIKLGRFLLDRFSEAQLDQFTQAERVRMAFEQLGPTFIKLGQLLATRPDLVPPEFVDEFKRLHDQVQHLPFAAFQTVLEEHYGASLKDVFAEFQNAPIAAASIAQVYKAKLISGEDVVVKVLRPGIEAIIEDDLSVLYTLAELLTKYIPETRMYNLVGIVNEFFKTLALETDFVVEANNVKRFADNFSNQGEICVPKVYLDLSGHKVLVMEAMTGLPLSSARALQQPGVDPQQILRRGLRMYLKMVFQDGLFHGDLHAGNLLIYPDNRIGLIDFGVVGRLNRRSQDAIASMLIALASEDYERLTYEYVDLAPFVPHLDVDRLAGEIRDVIAPYFGLTTRNINLGKVLLDSTAVAARHGLMLPAELMLFFKSIIAVEGIARNLSPDFDFLTAALEFTGELMSARFDAGKTFKDLSMVGRESTALIYTLPRQVRQILRRLNSPDFAVQLRVEHVEELKRSVESSANLLFLGLIIGSLILSGSLTLKAQEPSWILGLPPVSAVCFVSALVLSLLAFHNYISK